MLYVGIFAAGILIGVLLALWLRPAKSTAGETTAQPRIAALEAQLSTRESEITRLQQESTALHYDLRQKSLDLGNLQGELKSARESAQKEIAAFKEAQSTAEDRFSALARHALKENSASLLQLAKPEFESKQKAIDDLVAPIREALTKLETETSKLEVKREGAYKEVLTEIKNIQQTHESIRRETSQLVQALRAPKARGNWGELQLRRCIEFAGMQEHCSFEMEKYLRNDDDSISRPDCVVQLPSGRSIIIDAKTPLSAFLEASEATDEIIRAERLQAHAAQVRAHLDSLESKAYWRQFQAKGTDTPDFVVCFLPSEVLFSAALEQDPKLIEYGSGQVILATPTTLIALLKAVAYGWQQMKLTRDAQAIRQAAVAIYDKLRTASESFTAIGTRIRGAADAWEKMRTQVEGRGGLFSHARKLNQLGIGETEIAEVRELAVDMTDLQADDWTEPQQLKLTDKSQ